MRPHDKHDNAASGPEVRRAIASSLDVPVAQLSPYARLVEDLGAGELELERLALALEARFEIDVEDEELPSLRTVQDVLELVARRLPATRAH